MQTPLRIGYHHLHKSEALDSLISEKAEELERYFSGIVGCSVVVEHPGYHHRKGAGAHYRVRIELRVPGDLLVVGRDPAKTTTHEDAFLAVNEAFHAMRRKLQDHVQRLRREVKAHVGPPEARVARLFKEEGYGFLQTPDGRDIYFHRASVVNGGFERLKVGTRVRFSEEQGEKGPQASSVDISGRENAHPPAAEAHP